MCNFDWQWISIITNMKNLDDQHLLAILKKQKSLKAGLRINGHAWWLIFRCNPDKKIIKKHKKEVFKRRINGIDVCFNRAQFNHFISSLVITIYKERWKFSILDFPLINDLGNPVLFLSMYVTTLLKNETALTYCATVYISFSNIWFLVVSWIPQRNHYGIYSNLGIRDIM